MSFSDIDECAVENGFCDHTCHNTNGSYYCSCQAGFVLLDDKAGCEGIIIYFGKIFQFKISCTLCAPTHMCDD